MTKALLIDAQGAGSDGRALVEWIPAGLRKIAGILEDRGIDYGLEFVEKVVKKGVRKGDYDFILMTGMSSDFDMIRRAGALLKGWGIPLVVGGPVAFEPARVIEEAEADIVIIGEGEKSFSRLLQEGLGDGHLPGADELGGMEGLGFRNQGGLVQANKPLGYLSREELGKYRSSVSMIRYYPFHGEIMVVMEILRGCSNFHKPKVYHQRECLPDCSRCESEDLSLRLSCPLGAPGGCGFCSVGGLYGPPRSREQEAIIEELEGLIREGATKITILDPDPLDYMRDELVAPMPLTDPEGPMPNYKEIERLGELIWGIPEVAKEDVVVTVRDVKATLVNDRSVELLKRYFPRSVFGIGCESGSRLHSIKLGRPYEPEIVLQAAKTFHRHGIKPKINMIAGLPWQDEKTTDETLKLIDRLEPYVSHFDFARFESLPMSGFDDHQSDTGPLIDENTKRMLERSYSIQKRLFQRFIGEKLKVVIGRYGSSNNGPRGGGERTPRRGFRRLAGVVGYPIFDKRQLSLYATVVAITSGGESLENGDVAEVLVEGVSKLGFRMILEGSVRTQASS